MSDTGRIRGPSSSRTSASQKQRSSGEFISRMTSQHPCVIVALVASPNSGAHSPMSRRNS
eukprot:23709-Pelagococcus_subviridis.AAC.1